MINEYSANSFDPIDILQDVELLFYRPHDHVYLVGEPSKLHHLKVIPCEFPTAVTFIPVPLQLLPRAKAQIRTRTTCFPQAVVALSSVQSIHNTPQTPT